MRLTMLARVLLYTALGTLYAAGLAVEVCRLAFGRRTSYKYACHVVRQ